MSETVDPHGRLFRLEKADEADAIEEKTEEADTVEDRAEEVKEEPSEAEPQ